MNETNNLLHTIKEVCHVYQQEQVNTRLSEGWVLLAVATGQEQTGPHDYTPTFRYTVGRVK